MDKIKISIVTGLGEEVSRHFSFSFEEKASQVSNKSVVITEHYVAANCIIPNLAHAQSVRDALIDALMLGMLAPSKLILIPCNSVHIATPALKQAFGDSFIPIDEVTISQINRDGRRGRFLILGTSTTVESGMYQDSLRRLGCESVVLPPSAQAAFDDFIFKELVMGEMNASHLHTLRELESRYMELLGADHVILACTELCYLVQMFSTPLGCEVDSLQALHDAGIERLQTLLGDGLNHAN